VNALGKVARPPLNEFVFVFVYVVKYSSISREGIYSDCLCRCLPTACWSSWLPCNDDVVVVIVVDVTVDKQIKNKNEERILNIYISSYFILSADGLLTLSAVSVVSIDGLLTLLSADD